MLRFSAAMSENLHPWEAFENDPKRHAEAVKIASENDWFHDNTKKGIGSGGYAEIFRWRDDFVVKILHACKMELVSEQPALAAALPSTAKIWSYHAELKEKEFDQGLLMDHIPGISGWEIQRNHVSISESVRCRIASDILECVRELDDAHIVHRDIKPRNLILDLSGKTRLLDLDTARRWGEIQKKNSFTPAYAAPEIFNGGGYRNATDVYMAGLTLLSLFTGVEPMEYLRATNVAEVVRVHNNRQSESRLAEAARTFITNPEMRELVQRTVQWDPDKRPLAKDIAHWFDDIAAPRNIARQEMLKHSVIFRDGTHEWHKGVCMEYEEQSGFSISDR
jgi:serine/threonine protein kinase